MKSEKAKLKRVVNRRQFLILISLFFFFLGSYRETVNQMEGVIEVAKIYLANDNYSIIDFDVELKEEENLFDTVIEIGSRDGHRNYIFGEIKKVVVHNDIIFALDTRENRIKKFGLDGNWIANYNLHGRGPGESLVPIDMVFDEFNNEFVVLDNFGKVIMLSVEDDNLVLKDEFQVEGFCQVIGSLEDFFVVLHRTNEPETYNEMGKNIKIYDKKSGEIVKSMGDTYLSKNWLVSRGLTRGAIFCIGEEIYVTNWYVPRLVIYGVSDHENVEKIWFSNLNVVQLVSSLNERGLPRVSFDLSNGGGIINNAIATDVDIFVQLFERPDRDRENTYTYQIDRKTSQIKRKFDDIGFVHQITDHYMVTSVNLPYPKIVEYKR